MDIQPIIVCGTGRSGTTIFTKLIGLHPEVWAFRWESQILSGLPGIGDLIVSRFNGNQVENFRRRVLEHLYKRSVDGRYDAGLFEIVEYEVLQSALEMLEEVLKSDCGFGAKIAACREFCEVLFAPPAREKKASYWCEKTPRNLLYADIIGEIFPEAKFLNVVRDGRDVTSSILEKKIWPVARSGRFPQTRNFSGPQTFDKVEGYWTTLIDIGFEQEARLGPDRWMNVRLEDFSARPEETFTDVFGFLGLDPSSWLSGDYRRYLRTSSVNNERWRRDLTDEQAARLIGSSKYNLERLGYRS